jgi:glycosyltransferase involved in cell wall biosynthesis
MSQHPDWRLMIVGDGPLRAELEQQIEQSGFREQIVLLGFRQDVSRLLKTASVFLLPSLWEGQSNAVSEAMAAGLPVIASDVEGVAGIVQPGVTGSIVPAGNVDALRAAITLTLDAPDELKRLSGNTHLSAKSLLTAEGMVRQYADLYARLLRIGRF